ncbi:type IV pili methyl-accepting chemotaxis transducer N-terminal domain-containing protein [Thauera sp. ZXT1-4]|uniref:type IV pili methyl-accepting chemotaxis transducer N-terminal domain-containing protein n=1 Tax=Thauera sp. ZXT1-4 TaxID=3460294 RepID=UPI004040C5DE
MIPRSSTRRAVQRDHFSCCALFSALDAGRLDALCAASRLIELPARETLYDAGDPLREAYMLRSGSVVRFQKLAADGRKVIELVQGPQMLALGEVLALARYESTCETTSAAEAVAIRVAVLRRLMMEDARLAARTIEVLAKRQCAIEFDVTGHRSGAIVAQRMLDYLLELAGGHVPLAGETTVELKAPKKVIAARLGITPEAFSRSLRELSDKGVIVVDKSRIHIQNAALLDTGAGEAPRRLSFARKLRTPRGTPEKGLAPGELVNLCGKLRLLSPRLALAWALVAHGVTPADARVKLRQRASELERILARLRGAQLALRLGDALDVLDDAWVTYEYSLAAPSEADGAACRVLAASEVFLGAADALTTLAEHAAGGQLARYVNIAGRNRMLSQRMLKFFSFKDLAQCESEADVEIARSAEEFEANLAELRQSGQALPELLAQLDEVDEQWRRFNEALVSDERGLRRSRQLRKVLGESSRLLRYVDTAVKLYERLIR